MSPAFGTETVIHVHHWTDAYFSFITTRDTGFRFRKRPICNDWFGNRNKTAFTRLLHCKCQLGGATGILSIKVKNGLLTSRLQHIKPGDKILVGKKPTGTLLIHDLHPGRHLYLLGTGTGLAPWLSIIKDPETYERFDKVILTHGVRYSKDLAYRDYF